MELDGKKSKAINLPTVEFDPQANTTVLVSGWGVPDSEVFQYTEEMMALNLTVVKRENCRKQFKVIKKGKLITDQVFCAGGTHQGELCLDLADAGDPAVQKNAQKNRHIGRSGHLSPLVS